MAAAVLLALGTGTAAAQQSQQPSELPSAQQSERSQTSQSQPQSQSQSERQSQSEQMPSRDSSTAQSSAQSSGGAADIDQLAQEHEDLSTFFEAVKAAGMEDSLTAGTDYTLFAPTNDAFEQMSGMSTEELLQPQNREQLISLLRAHIVADDVDEQMAQNLNEAQTIDGGSVSIDASQDEWRVGDARVVEEGVEAGNLRVYAIDSVLEPTQVARADDLGSESGLDQGSSETDFDSGLDSQSQRSGAGSSELPGASRDQSRPGAQSSPGQSSPGQSGLGDQSDEPRSSPGQIGSQRQDQSQPGQIQAPGSRSPVADRELEESERD